MSFFNARTNLGLYIVLQSHKADRAALISVSLATSLHCEITDTGLVHRAVCLLTSQLSQYSLRLRTEGWPGWV